MPIWIRLNADRVRKGSGNGPLLLIAAHLDTVFPEEQIQPSVSVMVGITRQALR